MKLLRLIDSDEINRKMQKFCAHHFLAMWPLLLVAAPGVILLSVGVCTFLVDLVLITLGFI